MGMPGLVNKGSNAAISFYSFNFGSLLVNPLANTGILPFENEWNKVDSMAAAPSMLQQQLQEKHRHTDTPPPPRTHTRSPKQ